MVVPPPCCCCCCCETTLFTIIGAGAAAGAAAGAGAGCGGGGWVSEKGHKSMRGNKLLCSLQATHLLLDNSVHYYYDNY